MPAKYVTAKRLFRNTIERVDLFTSGTVQWRLRVREPGTRTRQLGQALLFEMPYLHLEG